MAYYSNFEMSINKHIFWYKTFCVIVYFWTNGFWPRYALVKICEQIKQRSPGEKESAELRGWEMRTVGGGGGLDLSHTVLIPHSRTSQLTVSVGGGGGWGSGGWATTPPCHKLEGWPTLIGVEAGGKVVPCTHAWRGQILHRLWSIQTVTISAVNGQEQFKNILYTIIYIL